MFSKPHLRTMKVVINLKIKYAIVIHSLILFPLLQSVYFLQALIGRGTDALIEMRIK